MTSLLRDPLTIATPVPWRPQAEEKASPVVDPVFEALRRDNESLSEALAKSQTEKEAEVASAYAKGKADAEAAFRRDESSRLKALESTLAAMVGEGRAQFKHIERLALLLCETSLERVFERSSDLQDLAARAIALQMRTLRRETILSLRVSASDFPDESALSALERNLALKGSHVRIECDPGMKAGESVIQLRLGHVEISLPEHWEALQSALRTMAANNDAP